MSFKNFLLAININPDLYMKIAKNTAKIQDYDPELLHFSTNDKYKLNYNGINFGANGYNDYVVYSILYDNGYAELKRMNYKKRAYKVFINESNPESRSHLSWYILW